jgi:hypothetical protein
MTCVDLRALMDRRDIDIGVCNTFVPITIVPKGVLLKSTVREIGQAMRKDLLNKKDHGGLFIFTDPERAHRHGASHLCLTNMGPLVIRPPFGDVWIQQMMTSTDAAGSLVFLSFSKIDEKRNQFFGRVRYSANVFTEREANGFRASIRYAMEKLDQNTPADVAVRTLARVQKDVTA